MSADDTTGFHTVQPKKPLCDFFFFKERKKSDEFARKGLAFQLFLRIKLPNDSEAPPPTPASPEQGKQSRATLCKHLHRVQSETPRLRARAAVRTVCSLSSWAKPLPGLRKDQTLPSKEATQTDTLRTPSAPPSPRYQPGREGKTQLWGPRAPPPTLRTGFSPGQQPPPPEPWTSHPGETLDSFPREGASPRAQE